MKFYEHRLENGLQIVGEQNDHVQSLAIGFFVRAGSRDESLDVSGVSHFLEHMAFKGDENRSADDVNRIFDDVGARYNASTSEEITLYYAAILPEYLSQTFEVLAGLLYPSLRQDDFDMEKKVILEEIGMYDDQPTFTAYEKLMQVHFAGHPLGRSILGSTDSIKALTSEQMQKYHRDQYRAGNFTLAIAGRFDWDDVLQMVNKQCADWPAGVNPRPTYEAHPTGGMLIIPKEQSLQQHVMQMIPAPGAKSPLRFAADLLSVIVGDDSGSRLYWEIADPGYAEAAEIGYNEYEGSGTFLSYLSCDPESTEENMEKMNAVFDDINKNGVTQAELEQAINKVASRIVLRGERPMGRLSSLGGNWVYRQEYRTIEADLVDVQSVTVDDIRAVLDEYPLANPTTVAIGPLTALCGVTADSSTVV